MSGVGGRNNTFAYAPRAVPQAVPPAAPQDDALPAPPVAPQAPRQNYGRGFDQNDNGYGPNFNQRRGFGGGFLGVIGGIFRFIGTLLLIGLIVFAVRMLFFRRGWGGPNGHRGMPPFFDEWHKRAHEPQAAQPAPDVPASDATKPAEGDVSGPATEAKPEDKPQDPQAI